MSSRGGDSVRSLTLKGVWGLSAGFSVTKLRRKVFRKSFKNIPCSAQDNTGCLDSRQRVEMSSS